jgi:uncharacterized protein (TIGR00730 family)
VNIPCNSADANLEPIHELHFTRTNGAIDELVDSLVHLAGGIRHAEVVRQMILAALKAGQENQGMADLKLMNSALKEMRFTSKVFSPYRHKKKIAVFGSARVPPEAAPYKMARTFGALAVRAGFMVITGGGGGIMQAVNEGAGPEHSFGVNIRLPFEQRANHILEGSPRHIIYKYFFTRKVAFLKEAHGVVLFPGGLGTQDEAMETLTLVQTGKHAPMPVVLLDEPGGEYWRDWQKFIRSGPLAHNYINPDDLALFSYTESTKSALAEIENFYRRYHSIRYVDGELVMRLCAPVPSEDLRRLSAEFSDMLIPGGAIYAMAALPAEQDEPEIRHLPRLKIDFNKKKFGRLRQFIDRLNGM